MRIGPRQIELLRVALRYAEAGIQSELVAMYKAAQWEDPSPLLQLLEDIRQFREFLILFTHHEN